MRICLDVSPAVHRRAGIGRYALELAAELARAGRGDEYLTFYNRATEARIQPELARLSSLTSNQGDKAWRARVLLAHVVRSPQDRLFPGVDLFHATDHVLPRLDQVRSVFTLHDLTFRVCAQTHATLNRRYLTLMVPRFLRAADAIVVDSESTRRDALRLYRLDEARIRVVYPGVQGRFQPISPEAACAVRARYGLPARFILYVGMIEPRKNLTVLLEAYARLLGERADGMADLPSQEGLFLVIAGRRGWLAEGFFRRLAELGLGERVIFPGYVDDDDLPALYSAAELFVFPSLYEGFGMPVLEAMACGTPVVCSDSSSLPEVAGDAALMVPPQDVQGFAAALRRALADRQLRAEMRGRGLARAASFSWVRTAREMESVYHAVLQPRDHLPR